MASTSATDSSSPLLAALTDVVISLRSELAFFGSCAAVWLISRLLGLDLRGSSKKKPYSAAKPMSEGSLASRPSTSTSRVAASTTRRMGSLAAAGIAALPAPSLSELADPSAAQLCDARWVFSAVLQLSRTQDQQAALDMHRKGQRAGMNLRALSKVEGSQLFMILVCSAIRLGRTGDALTLLRQCREQGPGISLGLLTSATKLATANQNFKECLGLYEYVSQDKGLVVDDRCVFSCLLFCAVESHTYHLVETFWGRLKECGGPTYKDFGNMMRYSSARVEWKLALELLAEMREIGLDIERVIYNTALAICVASNQLDEAVSLLAEMEKSDGLTDVITYNTLAKGYAKAGKLDSCFELCGRLRSSGLEPSQVTYGILLDCCITQNHMEKARQVFNHMLDEGCAMNTVLYTTMIKGFARFKHLDEAMNVYRQMRADTSGNIAPDVITFSILIKANCDAGRLKVAMNLLDSMVELKLVPDEIVYNNLIGGCLPEANTELAKRIYNRMVDGGTKPSTATFSILIRLYTSCKMTDHAVELLAKEGAVRGLEAAPRLYLQLVQCCLRDRQGRRAVEVYKMMPQPASALTHEQLLSMCAKLNMLETGAEILVIAAEKGGAVALADAERLRDAAVKKKRTPCAEMIEEAMGRLRLVR